METYTCMLRIIFKFLFQDLFNNVIFRTQLKILMKQFKQQVDKLFDFVQVILIICIKYLFEIKSVIFTIVIHFYKLRNVGIKLYMKDRPRGKMPEYGTFDTQLIIRSFK